MSKKRLKKFNVITVGGATRDIMFFSKEGELFSTGRATKQKLLAFEYGAKILADKLYFTFGGGASNTAVTFSKLGLKTAVICRIGNDDNGREAFKNLKSNKIDTSFVKIDRRQATGFSVILTINNVAKEHILFAHRGANDYLNALDLSLNKFETDWFYVSSLPKNGWEKIMRRLIATDKSIAWNPGYQQLISISLMKRILPKIDVLMLNRDEALEFRRLKNIKGLLKYIYNLGPEIIVITDGRNGAYAYDGQTYYYSKIRIAKNIDTVGIGDSFNSAFTSGLIYNKSIKECLRWGMNNSASVIAKIGAQNGILTKRQIMR